MRTVAVVDDATVIRESLPALMPGLRFAGGWSTIEAMLAARPVADALVLDLHLSNASQPDVRQGVAAIRAAVAAGYRVCVFSQEERRFVLAACLAAGASGVVSKSAPTARAEEVITAVADGEVVVPPSVIGLVEVLVRRNSLTILSERQRQVLAGRARGLTYAEMSTQAPPVGVNPARLLGRGEPQRLGALPAGRARRASSTRWGSARRPARVLAGSRRAYRGRCGTPCRGADGAGGGRAPGRTVVAPASDEVSGRHTGCHVTATPGGFCSRSADRHGAGVPDGVDHL